MSMLLPSPSGLDGTALSFLQSKGMYWLSLNIPAYLYCRGLWWLLQSPTEHGRGVGGFGEQVSAWLCCPPPIIRGWGEDEGVLTWMWSRLWTFLLLQWPSFSLSSQLCPVMSDSLCLVTQSCPALCNSMDHSLPGSSVHGDSSGKNTRVGCHALLQGTFSTQGLNPGLLHCRQILYHLSHPLPSEEIISLFSCPDAWHIWHGPEKLPTLYHHLYFQFSSVQSLSYVQLFVTPWAAAHQASLSITNSWSLLKLMSIELVIKSNHLVLCRPLFLLLSIFPSNRSFQMSQLFTSGGQSIRVSASTSVPPMNTQDWFPLGWTGCISLQSKGLSRVFSNTTVQKHQFFGTYLSL